MSPDEVSAQLARLEGMANNSMKPDLKKWLIKRKKVLSQFADAKDEL